MGNLGISAAQTRLQLPPPLLRFDFHDAFTDPETYLPTGTYLYGQNLFSYIGWDYSVYGDLTVSGIPVLHVDHEADAYVEYDVPYFGPFVLEIVAGLRSVPATGTTMAIWGDTDNNYVSLRTYDDPSDGEQHWGIAVYADGVYIDGAPWVYLLAFTDALVDTDPHVFRLNFTTDLAAPILAIDGVEYPFTGYCGDDGTVGAVWPPTEGWWDQTTMGDRTGITDGTNTWEWWGAAPYTYQYLGWSGDYNGYFDTLGDGTLTTAPNDFWIAEIRLYGSEIPTTGARIGSPELRYIENDLRRNWEWPPTVAVVP